MKTQLEKSQRQKIYNKKYRSSANGKLKTKESILKYRKSEKYLKTRREYYRKSILHSE